MNGRFLIAGLVGGLALAGIGLSQRAEAAQSQELDPVRAEALDRTETAFTRHNRQHREWEIQRSIEAQQRGRHHGYGHGRGYGRGYGPPPGHGYYRRPAFDRGYAYRRVRPYGYY